jgi:hypothetical protein
MAQKKLGEYATPSEDYIRAPITQPAIEAENYEIKPNYLSLVQQNQFGVSTFEDAGLHLNTFTEICDMMRVTPQNWHLANYSNHATIRMMSLWKRPPSKMCKSQHTHYVGGIKVVTLHKFMMEPTK